MSLILYLIFLLLTGFVAGIFRYHALIILFIGEILLGIFVLLQLLISAFRLRVSLGGKNWIVEKGKPGKGIITINNRSPFPVNHFVLKGFTSYLDGRQRKSFQLRDGLDLKACQVPFPISGDYAGVKRFSLTRFSLRDILSLFFFTRRLNEKTSIFVLPTRRKMNVEFSQATLGLIEASKQMNDPSQNRDEFRQVRDYVHGDAWRDVDWHKSAKADKLVVREYDREAEAFMDLDLDGRGYRAMGTEALDKYYELLSALIRGIVSSGITLRVNRLTKDGTYKAQQIIRDEEDIDAFFMDLYSLGIYDPGNQNRPAKASSDLSAPNHLWLGLDYRLMLGNKLLHAFDGENPDKDIEANLIVI